MTRKKSGKSTPSELPATLLFDEKTKEQAGVKTVVSRRRRTTVEDALNDPVRMGTFLTYLKAGASWTSASVTGLKVPYETVRKWLLRGQTATRGPYKRLYDEVMDAVGEAAVVAEAQVKARDPLTWLRQGPGRMVSPEWSDSEERLLAAQERTGPGNAIVISSDSLREALAHLKDSGVDLNHLSLDQSRLRPGLPGTVDGSVVDGPDDTAAYDQDDSESAAENSGTNYAENGRWKSTNESLPKALTQAVDDLLNDLRPKK